MEVSVINKILDFGPAIAISIGMIWYFIKKEQANQTFVDNVMSLNDDREKRYLEREKESVEREKGYQNTINELVEKFDMIEDVKDSFDDLRKDVSDIKERLEK